MKKLTILFFINLVVFAYSQPNEENKIIIDTVKFHFKLKGIADITSFVPQIKSGKFEKVSKGKITKCGNESYGI